MQRVLDASSSGGGAHLKSIITDDRSVSAADLAERLTGMRLLALATTTRRGDPLVSPVDGIFYRGRFWFGSSAGALKMRHIQERPRVSATHMEGEAFAITVHGAATIQGSTADIAATEFGDAARGIYGDAWLAWGEGAVYAAITPRRMFTFHLDEADRPG